MINDVIIRDIKKDEIAELLVLCEEHALYEKADFSHEDKKQRLEEYLFQDNSPLYCIVVEYKGNLIAYTTVMKQFSTWDVSFYLYMDCLYINEKYRSLGLGKKLLEKIKQRAKILNCNLIQWQTPSFNTKAINFYKNNNAVSKTKERFFLTII